MGASAFLKVVILGRLTMDRKLKILKAVLLLRKVNKYESKEEQIEQVEKCYSDELLDEWIELMKNPKSETEIKEESEEIPEYIEQEQYISTSCTAHDYSPSNPWDAPGMRISDFIKI